MLRAEISVSLRYSTVMQKIGLKDLNGKRKQGLVFKSKIRLKSPKSQNSRSSGSKTSNFGFSGFLVVFLT